MAACSAVVSTNGKAATKAGVKWCESCQETEPAGAMMHEWFVGQVRYKENHHA
jgi:hypothetical protein